MTDDSKCGLYSKYNVRRLDDDTGKHNDCPFFVLDLRHDPHARAALVAYAQSCYRYYPLLADDLMSLLKNTERSLSDAQETESKAEPPAAPDPREGDR